MRSGAVYCNPLIQVLFQRPGGDILHIGKNVGVGV
jgi:hypothetical protein